MCDICGLQCEGCGVMIHTHIGDFSVSREHVHPFCHKPECRAAAIRKLVRTMRSSDGEVECGGQYMVFSDMVTDAGAESPYEGAKRGKAVLFLVDMPRQVHTN